MKRLDGELAGTVAAVVDEGTFEAAARRLGLTTSAVSQRVKLLEAHLGRVLLVRSRPVRPTEAGEAILRLARQISLVEHDAATALGLSQDDLGGASTISLAVDADSIATWLLDPLTRSVTEHGIALELLRADPAETPRLLESGRVMAAVTSDTATVPGCVVSWLGNLRYTAVASESFIARWFASGVTAASAAHAPYISFDRLDGLQTEWLESMGVSRHTGRRHYIPSAHDLLRAVELDLGWAMAPTLQVVEPLAMGRIVELSPRPSHVPLHWQQWNLRSPVLDAMRASVESRAAEALEQPKRHGSPESSPNQRGARG
jgi:LysR family transcriptional regulator (chromosome initiation inhibitor)